MARGRGVGPLFSLAAVSVAAAASCSAPSKGALILTVSTDMQTPKDVNIVSVFVSTNAVPKFNYLARMLPDGTLSLPSTLAIVETDNPSDQVRVRVTAFLDQKARVMRDVLTTVPHQRTALLRVPLNFLDDGSAKGVLPAKFLPGPSGAPEGDTAFDPTDPQVLTSTCDITKGQTSIAGTCADAKVDPSKLHDYADSLVYGDGGTSANPACFDVTTCYAHARPITTVDMNTCSFPLPQGANGARWNCALQTTDGTGTCSGGMCLVPLETDPNEGFAVQGTTIAMVPGVCAKIMAGKASLFADNSAACAQKVEAAPVCNDATGVGTVDGGGDAEGPVDGAQASAEGAVPEAGDVAASDAAVDGMTVGLADASGDAGAP